MTSSVFGIDFGNETCVVSVAKSRQIDIVVNELSKRKTPAVISYTDTKRNIGESGLSSFRSNIKRTVTEIKRLIGRTSNQGELQNDAKYFLFDLNAMQNNQIAVKIGEMNLIPQQICASLFTCLRKIAETATNQKMKDCVISCPSYFPEKERIAILQAAKLADLNVMRLINETTAVALSYGIIRPLPKDKPIKILFLDIGHSSTNATLVSFMEAKLNVIAHASDSSLGGRDFDRALAHYFSTEIIRLYKFDPFTNLKSTTRLLEAANKAKLVLSANQEAQVSIECLTEDIDLSMKITRKQFENICFNLVRRTIEPVRTVLENGKTSAEELHSVEIVGGCVRIPAIRECLGSFLGRPLLTTCNGDESVARGCGLQCAMLSPSFRVRQFEITDVSPYAVEICWGEISNDFASSNCLFEEKHELFVRFNTVPCLKQINFTRMTPFQIVLRYQNPEMLPHGTPQFISRIIVRPPEMNKDVIEPPKIRVKIVLDHNGLVGFRSIELCEKIEVVEKENNELKNKDENELKNKGEEESKPQPKTTENNNSANVEEENNTNEELKTDSSDLKEETKPEKEEPKKKKSKIRKTSIPFEKIDLSLGEETMKAVYECEVELATKDRIVEEAEQARNELESYVYKMRSSLNYELKNFTPIEISSNFISQLDQTEDWLYSDEGHQSPKNVFIGRLNSLKSIGDQIITRKCEHNTRNELLVIIPSTFAPYKMFLNEAVNGNEKYNHISKEELEKVDQAICSFDKWISEMVEKQNKMELCVDPVVKVKDIKEKLNETVQICASVMNLPKPKEPEKPVEKSAEKGDKEVDLNEEDSKMQNGIDEPSKSECDGDKMDTK